VFNLSGTELVFIAVLGLIVLGPEKLPAAMRRAGKIYREFRNITNNVQREVQKVMDEPVRQVRQLVEEPAEELKKSAQDAGDLFAGKMPHLAPRPGSGAETAAAFDAATAPSAPTAGAPDAATPGAAAD
jgi:Tat protein translocase TatB subunit